MSMNGIFVALDNLPSQGIPYPNDTAVFIKPLKIKDQIDMERYGITDAEYFRILLEGISVDGSINKNQLLHSDVQFLDLIRRLYSFDVQEEITIKDYECPNCKHKFDFNFKMQDLTFTDFSKDIFGKHFILGKDTEDELEIVVSPLTVFEFMKMSKEFKNFKEKRTMLSSIYSEYLCNCIREVVGREFKDDKSRNTFLKEYIDDIYRAQDKKILKQIADETVIRIKPFKYICDDCEEEVEVEVTPTSNFQQ